MEETAESLTDSVTVMSVAFKLGNSKYFATV